jgi:hypothetical protein
LAPRSPQRQTPSGPRRVAQGSDPGSPQHCGGTGHEHDSAHSDPRSGWPRRSDRPRQCRHLRPHGRGSKGLAYEPTGFTRALRPRPDRLGSARPRRLLSQILGTSHQAAVMARRPASERFGFGGSKPGCRCRSGAVPNVRPVTRIEPRAPERRSGTSGAGSAGPGSCSADLALLCSKIEDVAQCPLYKRHISPDRELAALLSQWPDLHPS